MVAFKNNFRKTSCRLYGSGISRSRMSEISPKNMDPFDFGFIQCFQTLLCLFVCMYNRNYEFNYFVFCEYMLKIEWRKIVETILTIMTIFCIRENILYLFVHMPKYMLHMHTMQRFPSKWKDGNILSISSNHIFYKGIRQNISLYHQITIKVAPDAYINVCWKHLSMLVGRPHALDTIQSDWKWQYINHLFVSVRSLFKLAAASWNSFKT